MPVAVRMGLWVGGVGLALLALAWALTTGYHAEAGAPSEIGPVGLWLVPVSKLALNLFGAATAGVIVLAVFTLPSSGAAWHSALRIGGISAAGGALSAAVFTVLSFQLFANELSSSQTFSANLLTFITTAEAGRGGAAAFALTAVVAAACLMAHRQWQAAAVAMLSLAAPTPLVLNSHSSDSAGHSDSTITLLLHSSSATIWLGGLLGLLLLRRRIPSFLWGSVVSRYSSLALACFVLLSVSGTMAVWSVIGSWERLTTPYGTIAVAKAAALVVLGACGLAHRRWVVRRLASSQGQQRMRPFVILATFELALMGAASGLAAGLARTAPPIVDEVINPAASLPFPNLFAFISQWKPDPVWLLIAGISLFFYSAGVLRVRGFGQAWPVMRTMSWCAGILVLAVITNGGLRVYQQYLLLPHVLSQMLLMVAVPIFLVAAAPLSLARRTITARTDGSAGGLEFLERILDPILARLAKEPLAALMATAATLVLIYTSPLFEWSARGQLGYTIMALSSLLAGCLFVNSLMLRAPAPPLLESLIMVAGSGILYWICGRLVGAATSDLEAFWYVTYGRPWGAAAAATAEQVSTVIWSLGAAQVSLLAMVLLLKRKTTRARGAPTDPASTHADHLQTSGDSRVEQPYEDVKNLNESFPRQKVAPPNRR